MVFVYFTAKSMHAWHGQTLWHVILMRHKNGGGWFLDLGWCEAVRLYGVDKRNPCEISVDNFTM
jgi:hypothetical protein